MLEAILGIIGGGSAIITIYLFLRRGRRLRVSVQEERRLLCAVLGDHKADYRYWIRVDMLNRRPRTVHVVNVELQARAHTKHGKVTAAINEGQDLRIEDGESDAVLFDKSGIIEALEPDGADSIKLRASVRDSLGSRHSSAWIVVGPEHGLFTE
jgi:hypothetical protein